MRPPLWCLIQDVSEVYGANRIRLSKLLIWLLPNQSYNFTSNTAFLCLCSFKIEIKIATLWEIWLGPISKIYKLRFSVTSNCYMISSQTRQSLCHYGTTVLAQLPSWPHTRVKLKMHLYWLDFSKFGMCWLGTQFWVWTSDSGIHFINQKAFWF